MAIATMSGLWETGVHHARVTALGLPSASTQVATTTGRGSRITSSPSRTGTFSYTLFHSSLP